MASLLLCNTGTAAYTVVGGDVVVDRGRITTLDLPPLLETHRAMAQRLVAGELA